MSAGRLLREAVAAHKPLQVVGAINAYTAIMAEKTGKENVNNKIIERLNSFTHLAIGFKAIYLSGSGVAAASHGYIS